MCRRDDPCGGAHARPAVPAVRGIDVIRIAKTVSRPARRHGVDRFAPANRPHRPAAERRGEERARQLGERLRRFSFARVFTSPLQRASKTCSLAGFGEVAEVDPDLVEWDYGRFEGKLTGQILRERPGWELFRDGCPDGESPRDVAARADRFIARVRGIDGRRPGVLQRSHHPHDRCPLARPAAGGRAVFLLPARQRWRTRLRAQQPRRTDHRPVELRHSPAGVTPSASEWRRTCLRQA